MMNNRKAGSRLSMVVLQLSIEINACQAFVLRVCCRPPIAQISREVDSTGRLYAYPKLHHHVLGWDLV